MTSQARTAPRPARSQRALRLAALLLFGAFAAVAVAIRFPSVAEWDQALSDAVHLGGGPAVRALLTGVSRAGAPTEIFYLVPLAVAALLSRRRGRLLRFIAATEIAALALEGVAKFALHRPRPAFRPVTHFDSFPSGHVLEATVLVGMLLTILLPDCRRPWERAALWAAGALWVLLMAAARIYVGAHFLTDVIGGASLGAACVCLTASIPALAVRVKPTPADSPE